jgi:hypothetical protein
MLIAHLRICGALLLALSLLHLVFPARFQWRQDLGKLTLLNRQIFYVHTFFLCVVLVMMGLLCLFGATALVAPSPLGVWVAAGLTIFWQLRWVSQHFVYDSSLWRGKPLETIVHVMFSLLWTYLCVIYGWLLWHQLH